MLMLNQTVTAMFFTWGNGDGSTTFNFPDYRGLIPMGNNIMGGIASSNISDANFGTASASSCWWSRWRCRLRTLLTANLPPQTPRLATVALLMVPFAGHMVLQRSGGW